VSISLCDTPTLGSSLMRLAGKKRRADVKRLRARPGEAD
jgi:hypothetical protein